MPHTISNSHEQSRLTLAQRRWWPWAVSLALAVLTTAVFWPATRGGFVNVDDDLYVFANEHVQRGLTADSIAWAFTTRAVSHWHPITWLSLMIDSQQFGLEPFGYHRTNVLLHALNCVLLFWIFLGLTFSWWRSALLAALFAVHPLRVESVAWIAERKDVLSIFFGLLAMGAYVAYVRRTRTGWYVVAALCFALSLMAKPTLVTLPMVLLLIDYWPLGRFAVAPGLGHPGPLPGATLNKDGGHSSALPHSVFGQVLPMGEGDMRRRFGLLILEKAPLLLLSAASCVVTLFVQGDRGPMANLENLGLGDRIANSAVAYVAYLGQMVRFDRLAVFYPLRVDIPLWKVAASLTVLAVVTVAAIRFRRRYPWLAVGWFWYLGTLVPVIGLVQVGGQSMADRYSYFPTIGLLLALCWSLPQRLIETATDRVGLAAGAATAIAVLVFATERQIAVWHDSRALYEHALAVTEGNWLAHGNLGAELALSGQTAAAIDHYQQALAIRPNYPDGHYNLAKALTAAGKNADAIRHYRRAVELRPDHVASRNNLGRALADAGESAAAIDELEQAIAIDPGYALAHFNLAFALAGAGRESEAIEQCRRAIALRPDHVVSHLALGTLLCRHGQFDEGLEHIRKAIRLEPGNPMAQEALREATRDQAGQK